MRTRPEETSTRKTSTTLQSGELQGAAQSDHLLESLQWLPLALRAPARKAFFWWSRRIGRVTRILFELCDADFVCVCQYCESCILHGAIREMMKCFGWLRDVNEPVNV